MSKERNDTRSNLSSKNIEEYELKYEYIPMNHKYKRFTKLYTIMVNYPELDLYDRVIYSEVRAFAEMPRNTRKNPNLPLITKVSNQTIADKTGISKRKVSEVLSHLQSLGIIFMYEGQRNKVRMIKVVKDFELEQPEQVKAREEYEKLYGSIATEDMTEDELNPWLEDYD